MKRRNSIYSVTSVFLIILLMIGSTGAVIVKHTCVSCGLSDFHTEFFSNVHTNHSCNCNEGVSSCHNHDENAIESGCCTFVSEKLSLSDYNNSSLINISIVEQPVLSCQDLSTHEQQEKSTFPLQILNKHGGRDVLISNCQLII
ncbi:MAG: hypothetical protein HZB98_13175 [Bacteroidia bacterium]|nr:hypothetical protein [Bacteroidia bacterium]